MAAAVAHRHGTDHHILNFFYDDSDGCALTVLVNTVRFHIIADADKLRAKRGPGVKLARDYRAILKQVKRQDNGEIPVKYGNDTDSGLDSEDDHKHSQRDSALGSSPPAADDKLVQEEPIIALKRWMLAPFADIFEQRASADQIKVEQKLDEWFSGPTLFYSLAIEDDDLIAREEKAAPDLERRMQALVPHIAMPQYITKLDIPLIPASDVTVLACSDEPAPYHPCRVRIGQETFFLKMCDPTQPQPTKRELKLLKEIESKGLHQQFKVPLVKHLIGHRDSRTEILGFTMTEIDTPTPLTTLLDEDIPALKRARWAQEADRIRSILHANGIIWGDAKADNFIVDAREDLWIIDFGGSYTEGWVDPGLAETREGDEMGLEKIVNALHDPVGMTVDVEASEVSGPNKNGEKSSDSEASAESDASESSAARRGNKKRRSREASTADKAEHQQAPSSLQRKHKRKNRCIGETEEAAGAEADTADEESNDENTKKKKTRL